MQFKVILIATITLMHGHVEAENDSDEINGFAVALYACEQWVLNPSTWDNFPEKLGMEGQLLSAPSVGEFYQPPEPLRVANYHWIVQGKSDSAVVLTVSYKIPMCHIVGEGQDALDRAVAEVLNGTEFSTRWSEKQSSSSGNVTSTSFGHVETPRFSFVISSSNIVQGASTYYGFMATAQYELVSRE